MLHPADDGQQARNSVVQGCTFFSGVTHTLLSYTCIYMYTCTCCVLPSRPPFRGKLCEMESPFADIPPRTLRKPPVGACTICTCIFVLCACVQSVHNTCTCINSLCIHLESSVQCIYMYMYSRHHYISPYGLVKYMYISVFMSAYTLQSKTCSVRTCIYMYMYTL